MAFVIQAQGQATASTLTSYAMTFSSNVSAGSSLLCGGMWTAAGFGLGNLTDNVNSSYQSLSAAYDSNTSRMVQIWNFDNCKAGATTVTLSCPANTGATSIFLIEIGQTGGYMQGSITSAVQFQPGTANNIITQPATGGATPKCLEIGLCMASGATASLTTGTIQTAKTLFIPVTTWAAGYTVIAERGTNGSLYLQNVSAAFTDATNGSTLTYFSYYLSYYINNNLTLGQSLSG
jgi:hypothetical protein